MRTTAQERPMTNRRSWLPWTGLAALAALAAWLLREAPPGAREASAARASRPGRAVEEPQPLPHISPALFAALSLSAQETVEEQLPQPGCWHGVLALDRSGSLAELREALRAALASGDTFLLAYVKDRMVEVVGDDASKALELLGWAKASSNPELMLYMEVLKDTSAVHKPEVADRLLDLATSGESPDLRSAALCGLETQRELDAEGLGALKGIALNDPSAPTAWVATRTLGQVMKENMARGGDPAPYWRELLDIGRSGPDEAVRALALEMPSYSELLLDSDSVTSVGALLRNDPDPLVREMAAHRLSVSGDPERALAALRAAFAGEPTLCVRWAIFRFSVRAAGAEALPALAEFARVDPRFVPEYQDFQRLYASGIADFSRIWLEKPERIQCGPEGGEGA